MCSHNGIYVTFMSGPSTSIGVLGNQLKARADCLLCSLLPCSHAVDHPEAIELAIWGSLALSALPNININLFISGIREVSSFVKGTAGMKISRNWCSKKSITQL